MFAADVDLLVEEQFRTYLPHKFERCSHELEDMIVQDGRARDPIVVWNKDGKLVVVDGHRRFEICKKHNLEFDVVEMEFASARAAKHWMDKTQFCRRNLDGHQRAVVIGRMDAYLEEEKAAGRFTGNAARAIAKQLNVTPRQVFRGKQDAKAIEKVEESLRDKIVSGELKVSSSTLKALSEMPEREQLNAADQVAAGEFATLGEAVCGTVDADETAAARTTLKPSRPKIAKRTIEEKVDTLPLDSETASSHDSGDVLQAAIKALGMLGKAMDALNERDPNEPRMSSIGSHISNIRNILKNWAREAA